MRPIKIKSGNEEKIDAALKAVNGRASAHTFCRYREVLDFVNRAEDLLRLFRIPAKYWKNAEILAVSGDHVPNTYQSIAKGHYRVATKVVVQRRATGWFINSIQKEIIGQQGGAFCLGLTTEQDAIAVKKLRDQYYIRD